MKQKNKVFFGEKGLTSTSANHIANLAKEYVANKIKSLNDINFVTTTIQTPDSSKSKFILETGISSLNGIQSDLDEIANMNSLIAWLREAIKAKDEELEAIKKYSYSDIFDDEPLISPQCNEVTELDILGEWNIKDRNEYYSLEAKAAVIGKFIHPNGGFSKARDKANKALLAPTTVDNSGTSTLIYCKEVSLPSKEIEDTFFNLQKEHREISAKLNQYKFKLKESCNDRNLKILKAFNDEMAEYTTQLKLRNSRLSEYKISESKKISELKILIPKNLEKVFEKINSLGKE